VALFSIDLSSSTASFSPPSFILSTLCTQAACSQHLDYFVSIYLLLQHIELANKKLEYYDIKFEKEALIESLLSKKRIWEKELKPLVGYVPDFEKTVDEIANAVEGRVYVFSLHSQKNKLGLY
jgi:hypothetical protein